MNCKNCGTPYVSGERFCKSCGYILESVNNQTVNTQTNMNTNINYNQNMNGNLNPNYVQQAVNPNMKKWLILSIIIPVVAIIWYWFIGLSFYLAIVIAAIGFSFAHKGEIADKKLSIIGKILNGMLVAMATIMFILVIVGVI